MRYDSIELGQPGKAKCPDAYDQDSTLICPDCQRLVLQVSRQAVVVQLGTMPSGKSLSPGAVQWQTEEPYLPLIASLGRTFDAVRIRNYTPGQEAQVFVSVA
jgi:hypothetical protein